MVIRLGIVLSKEEQSALLAYVNQECRVKQLFREDVVVSVTLAD